MGTIEPAQGKTSILLENEENIPQSIFNSSQVISIMIIVRSVVIYFLMAAWMLLLQTTKEGAWLTRRVKESERIILRETGKRRGRSSRRSEKNPQRGNSAVRVCYSRRLFGDDGCGGNEVEKYYRFVKAKYGADSYKLAAGGLAVSHVESVRSIVAKLYKDMYSKEMIVGELQYIIRTFEHHKMAASVTAATRVLEEVEETASSDLKKTMESIVSDKSLSLKLCMMLTGVGDEDTEISNYKSILAKVSIDRRVLFNGRMGDGKYQFESKLFVMQQVLPYFSQRGVKEVIEPDVELGDVRKIVNNRLLRKFMQVMPAKRRSAIICIGMAYSGAMTVITKKGAKLVGPMLINLDIRPDDLDEV